MKKNLINSNNILLGILSFLGVFILMNTSAFAALIPYSHSEPYTVVASVTPITVSLTANPNSMTLPTNQTALTWTSTGTPDSCTATASPSNPSATSWSGSRAINSVSPETINGLVAGTYSFTITCSKVGVSDATDTKLVVVSTAPTPSGTLSATNCLISAGAGNCSDTVSWMTQNLTAAPTVITRDVGSPASFTPSPLASGNIARVIGYGTTTFYLYHNGAEPPLATAPAIGSCVGGTTWISGSQTCEWIPSVTLTATPMSIPVSGSSVLTWDSQYATSCTSTNPDFATGNAADNTSPGVTVSPAATKTYNITCSGPGGVATNSVVVTVGGVGSTECSDGIDNDTDTFTDYPDDPGCTDLLDPTEKQKAIFEEV